MLIYDRFRLNNYIMFVCYCSFHGAHRYKVHDSTRLRYETVFIRYTVHDSTRTLDMKVSIRNKVHDSTKPIDMYVTLDTRQE